MGARRSEGPFPLPQGCPDPDLAKDGAASGTGPEAALAPLESRCAGGASSLAAHQVPACISARLRLPALAPQASPGDSPRQHPCCSACLHMCVSASLRALPLALLACVCFHRCLSLQVPLRTHMEVSIFAPVSFSMYLSVGPWLCTDLGVCVQ